MVRTDRQVGTESGHRHPVAPVIGDRPCPPPDHSPPGPREARRSHYDGPVVAIDWIVVRSAALAGLFVLVPSIIVLTLVLDDSASSGWIYLFGLLLVFGFLTAGYGAGRARSDTPMIHGAIAGLSCYVVIQLFGAISRLVRGETINPLQYPFLAVFSAALGASGALFADWYRRKGLRSSTS